MQRSLWEMERLQIWTLSLKLKKKTCSYFFLLGGSLIVANVNIKSIWTEKFSHQGSDDIGRIGRNVIEAITDCVNLWTWPSCTNSSKYLPWHLSCCYSTSKPAWRSFFFFSLHYTVCYNLEAEQLFQQVWSCYTLPFDKPADYASPIVGSVSLKCRGMCLCKDELELLLTKLGAIFWKLFPPIEYFWTQCANPPLPNLTPWEPQNRLLIYLTYVCIRNLVCTYN